MTPRTSRVVAPPITSAHPSHSRRGPMTSADTFARLADEFRAQWQYQRRLSSQIGPLNAIRARALGLRNRRLGSRATLRLHPATVAHPVWLRVASTDSDTYQQVLIDEQYGVFADLDPEWIVDCGANAGFTSAYLLSRFPRARVIAIEPFPDNAALCRRNLEPYGARAEVRCAAVWSHATRLVLEGHGGHEWGVQVREARAGETGDVDAIGLADLGLARIDLLKVDIEGSETALFRSGAADWLPTVGAIAIELHGPECEQAFEAALAGYEHALDRAGELTLVRHLRRR